MSLRKAVATALRLLRNERGLKQSDLALFQAHVSVLESGQTSLTTDSLHDLAKSLGVHPVAFLAIAYAAEAETDIDSILSSMNADLDQLSFRRQVIKNLSGKVMHPVAHRAAVTRARVQEMQSEGKTRAEVAKALGVSEVTVRRHWKR